MRAFREPPMRFRGLRFGGTEKANPRELSRAGKRWGLRPREEYGREGAGTQNLEKHTKRRKTRARRGCWALNLADAISYKSYYEDTSDVPSFFRPIHLVQNSRCKQSL